MITETEKQYIECSINSVVDLFHRYPNIFLTEDDLRMHLCSKLLEYFGRVEATNDGDISISLHTEVRWYGNGNLKYRSDIVLIDVSSLNVLRHNALPSKGYGFNIPKAIIELKLRRPNGEATSTFLKKIRNDLNKLQELKQIFANATGVGNSEFWMVIFDKKSQIHNLRNELAIPEGVQFIYEYSNRSEQVAQADRYFSGRS